MAIQNWQEWAQQVEKRLAALERRQDLSEIIDRLKELKGLIEAGGGGSVTTADIAALDLIKNRINLLDPVRP